MPLVGGEVAEIRRIRRPRRNLIRNLGLGLAGILFLLWLIGGRG